MSKLLSLGVALMCISLFLFDERAIKLVGYFPEP